MDSDEEEEAEEGEDEEVREAKILQQEQMEEEEQGRTTDTLAQPPSGLSLYRPSHSTLCFLPLRTHAHCLFSPTLLHTVSHPVFSPI